MRLTILAVIVGLAGSSACAPAETQTPVLTSAVVAPAPAPAPLRAPDEVEADHAAPRLTQSKTIGAGEATYDGAHAQQVGGTAPQSATTLRYADPPVATHYRTYGYGVHRSTCSRPGTRPAQPPVAGNWPAPPSYGPRTMK